MTAMTALRLRNEIDVIPETETATLSIWWNNDSEAYTLSVSPLSDEDREDYHSEGYTHVVKDGYSDDTYYRSFDDALSAAWDFYQTTETGNLNTARGLE